VTCGFTFASVAALGGWEELVVYWSELRAWLSRHRRLAIFLSAAFLIFEISRAVSVGQAFLPGWAAEMGVIVDRMVSRPPWIVALTFALALVFFAAPMAAVVYFAMKIRRGLSRYWTRINRQG
jgi:hypothetical protein